MARHAVPDLLPGTLDLLILRTLQTDSLHGWAISERIQQISQDVLQVNQGSLYPALQRMQLKGWIKSRWSQSPTGRRARYYELTAAGTRHLVRELEGFDRVIDAIRAVLAWRIP